MSDWLNRCHFGDCIETMRKMPNAIAQTCVTSPPYFGLRDYGHAGQIGLEETPAQFVAKLVEVFREVRRVLRDDGTLWLNLGDSYSTHAAGKVANPMAKSTLAGINTQSHANESSRAQGIYRKDASLPEKNLIGIPWRVAFALQADGWYLRQDIIWSKPNPMPESVQDRCTKAHEYMFLLSKSPRYYFDSEAMQEPSSVEAGRAPRRANSFARKVETGRPPGTPPSHREDREDVAYEGMRNKRSVWTVPTTPYAGAHFATFPIALIEPCILAGAPAGGVVLDPFFGSGTTGQVSQNLGRAFIGCELNPAYEALQAERLAQLGLMLEPA